MALVAISHFYLLFYFVITTLTASPSGNDALRQRRAATSRKERLWPHGIIPYAIASNFSGEHWNLFKKAMRHWEEKTCVSFVPRNSDDKHYILFTIDKCGCCSYVGRRGDGPQAISIGKNCDKFGIVVHELGHVVGFWHEHTRPDRDEFVDIFYRSIQPGQDYNFERAKPGEVNSRGEQYDFLSIMHYARDTFSRGLFYDTILPKPITGFSGEIGQRIQLSEGDIRQTKKMYECAQCGSALFGTTGVLEANNSRCVWRIVAPEGHTIFLNISHSIGESCSQHEGVNVRDGNWPTSPKLGNSCGDGVSRVLVSSSNRLYIEASFPSPPPQPFLVGSYDVVCGGPLYAARGRIESPSYPDAYPANSDCLWTIRVAEGKQVAIKIIFFHVEQHKECIYDRLVIHEGSSDEGLPISVLCGQTPTGTHVESQRSNQVTVRFSSDSSVQKAGFVLEFVEEENECTSSPCEHRCINTLGSFECQCNVGYSLRPDGRTCESTCGGFLVSSHGHIASPNFPHAYPPSKKCVWEIEAPVGSQIFLNVTQLNIEGTKSECTYDYLRIGEGEKMCGDHEKGFLITSKDHRLRVEFVSDSSVERGGFSLEYIADVDECAVDNGGCEHSCVNEIGGRRCVCHSGFVIASDGRNCKEGGCFYQINNAHGEISSPNYPDEYPKGVNCTWHFIAAPGHRLQLQRFSTFNLEEHTTCKYDVLSIQDGPLLPYGSLGSFCGSLIPPPISSSSNQLIVHFFSDTSVSRRGFQAQYDSVCGGQLTAERVSGLIYSHATYSEARYTQGRTCKWRIVASSPLLAVRIRFESFHLEADANCQYDYVKIYDSRTDDEDSLAGTFCGDTIPPEYVSSGRAVTLLLHTDDSVEERGFVAEYQETSPLTAHSTESSFQAATTSRPYDLLVNIQRR